MALTVYCPGCQAPLRVKEEYASQRLRCPSCGERVPAPDDAVVAVRPRRRTRTTSSPRPQTCPRCRRPNRPGARRCLSCHARLLPPDDSLTGTAEDPFMPCPRCGANGAQPVTWTFWGSFYGPSLFHHVRCPECECAYNGHTGGSNLFWAILFVAIPALIILAILGGLILLLAASAN